jgi:tetratricopeptide (TPR) repeat protein
MVFYAVLKTQAEVCVELRDFNQALKCWKNILGYCKSWNALQLQAWTLEATATCYKALTQYDMQLDCLQEALKISLELCDEEMELRLYQQMAICFYYKRAFKTA